MPVWPLGGPFSGPDCPKLALLTLEALGSPYQAATFHQKVSPKSFGQKKNVVSPVLVGHGGLVGGVGHGVTHGVGVVHGLVGGVGVGHGLVGGAGVYIGYTGYNGTPFLNAALVG